MTNKNPFPKDSISYTIWERNNNTECKEFWDNVVTKPHPTKKDQELIEEAKCVQS